MSGALMHVRLDLQLALGRAIRLRREALGLSRDVMAMRTGAHRQNIARAETGRHGLTFATLELYARGLGCRVSELVADAERLVADAREEAAE